MDVKAGLYSSTYTSYDGSRSTPTGTSPVTAAFVHERARDTLPKGEGFRSKPSCAEGREEDKIEMSLECLRSGIGIEKVAQLSGMSVAKIRKLAEENGIEIVG